GTSKSGRRRGARSQKSTTMKESVPRHGVQIGPMNGRSISSHQVLPLTLPPSPPCYAILRIQGELNFICDGLAIALRGAVTKIKPTPAYNHDDVVRETHARVLLYTSASSGATRHSGSPSTTETFVAG